MGGYNRARELANSDWSMLFEIKIVMKFTDMNEQYVEYSYTSE